MNLKFWRAYGLAVPFINAAFLFGITNGFNANVNSIMLNTGITWGVVVGILNLILGYGIYQKFV